MNLRQAAYPKSRHRRLRKSAEIRGLSRENNLCVKDLIWPIFVCEGQNLEVPVKSMPGVLDIVLIFSSKKQSLLQI